MAAAKALDQIEAAQCCGPLLAEPLAEERAVELARQFAALADPVRLRLLSLIASAEQVCSCDFEAPLGKSQPTISHHTKVLQEAGLIVGEKRGRWVWWRVVPERLDRLQEALSTVDARGLRTDSDGTADPAVASAR